VKHVRGQAQRQRVFAATRTQDGMLRVRRYRRYGADTQLAESCGWWKKREQQGADSTPAVRISGIFVPIVVAIKRDSFVAWWTLSGDFTQALITPSQCW